MIRALTVARLLGKYKRKVAAKRKKYKG